MRLPLLTLLPLAAAHARIKYPVPLGAPPEDLSGNDYNAPLPPDGSGFPCNHLHTDPRVDQTPTASWRAGSAASFEILGHLTPGEGALAAHSGGSCQASLSFDNGRTFRVLHTYHGGCPRDVSFGSNLAGPNQTFSFSIPSITRSGAALFAWTWIAVSGNRDEFYMDCAAVRILDGGTSTLDAHPHMFVGDMTLRGGIAEGECRSTAGAAVLFPEPGPEERVTVDEVVGIPFVPATGGRCFAPGGDAPDVSPSDPSSTPSSIPTAPPAYATEAPASTAYTPTEAVPSFLSSTPSPSPTGIAGSSTATGQCKCASTTTLTVTLMRPSPATTISTPSSSYISPSPATSPASASSPSTPEIAPTPPAAIPTTPAPIEPAPTITPEQPEHPAVEPVEVEVITHIVTVTTTLCPEHVAAAMAESAVAACASAAGGASGESGAAEGGSVGAGGAGEGQGHGYRHRRHRG